MNPLLDSSDLLQDGLELYRRLQRDGYLFIRRLLPAQVLEQLRLDFLNIAGRDGWLKAGTPVADAVADIDSFCVEPEPRYMACYGQFYRLPRFHALQHRPELVDLFTRMLGEPVLPHPRLIARAIFPQRETYTTPPHQDFIPIQGTPATYTAWIPLSDLPAEMGGLQIAAGSHTRGVYEFQPALGAGGIAVTDPLDGTWVSSTFEQGDVLFFHSMTVHKGVPNTSQTLRVSVDARFQKASDPIAPGSLLPHSQPDSWKEIYADWPDDELKHYWKGSDLQVVEYDNSYHEQRDQMAFDMAARGDRTAISALQRIVARDDDAANRHRAEELLQILEANTAE